MPNTFGHAFRITSFGESHGPAMGVVIDGCPARIPISREEIQADLHRRRPGQSAMTSARRESDKVEILSGVDQGLSMGAPICLLIANEDARPQDYAGFKKAYRPSHGDYTYHQKFGIAPLSGGGRLSARETVARVAGASVAKQFVRTLHPRTDVLAFVSSVKHIQARDYLPGTVTRDEIESSPLRCPDLDASARMVDLVEKVKVAGDSVGGCIRAWILNAPPNLGQPVFDKFDADLARAMLSIPAAKAFELGLGFLATERLGSEHNDAFRMQEGRVRARANNAGGVLGGITSGEPVSFRVGFKPTSTIAAPQQTVDLSGREVTQSFSGGRHDPCVLPRAVPIVEAMTWLVLADHLLRARGDQ